MNTPKRLLSGSDDVSEYPTTRRRSKSPNDNLTTPIDDQIEQVAKRHRVPSDTVKRIISDLLNESTVVDYLRTRIIQDESYSVNNTISITTSDESLLSSSNYFDTSSQINSSHVFSSDQQQQNLLLTTMVDEYDPLWLEFLQSLNTVDNNSNIQQNTTQSNVPFDSLFSEDDDDEEFIGPDDENNIETVDERKLRVSKRELASLLKDSAPSPDDHASFRDEEILRSDQYESLWTEFLASLQTGNDQQQDEQQKSIITTITEEDDNDDDPEFRLADTENDIDDDLEDELHVSKRELALLLQDNASILNNEEFQNSDEFINPESVSSNTTCSTITKTFEHHITSEQRDILQYQLTAYVQLLTQYILLRRETNSLLFDDQSAQQLFTDLIYFRDKQSNSILDIPLLTEAQHLLETAPPPSRRKAFGNHLSFYLMDTFCKSSAFVHDSLLPTCFLSSSNSNIQTFLNDKTSRNFVSGEDCLMALGLEQNDAKMLIIGHNEKAINDRLNSLRYARVRRGKQNPVKAFFTYGSVPDISLNPWYHVPNGFDIKQIYPNGLIEKVNVVFPSWFRLSYKRSRQLLKRTNNSLISSTLSSSTTAPRIDTNDDISSSTVYVVVEGTSSNSRTTTSPNKVLQQIHMLHLLNSYPKLQPKQQ
ncbi:unnamed protein product [Rotaria sp. Silwood1]|nr:unnamed protein product [Rotaria sp. Silwood1]CAF0906691.1 unnamed protein product [Rotaria sp. Silwood1]CAF3374745.1 unnamed protein product [Rotaria sp. Silwood1]CAF4666553.1 unnamed protein product [Rotaria sp. Silwood1]